eukprot:5656368-Prymnesium_polylepis.1
MTLQARARRRSAACFPARCLTRGMRGVALPAVAVEAAQWRGSWLGTGRRIRCSAGDRGRRAVEPRRFGCLRSATRLKLAPGPP